MLKNMQLADKCILLGAVTAIIGVMFYNITAYTGFLAGSATNMIPTLLTVGSLCMMGIYFKSNKASTLSDIIVVVMAVLYAIILAVFILERVSLIADIYFIPVNYPPAEETALNLSFVGLGFYIISIISSIVVSFKKI